MKLAALALLAACGAPAATQVFTADDGYAVTVEPEPARITLTAPDGHVVWQTQAGDAEVAPLGFAAVRELSGPVRVEMQAGSFRFHDEEVDESYRAIDRLEPLADAGPGRAAIALYAGDAQVGTGLVTLGTRGALEISLRVPGAAGVSLAAPSPADEHLVGLGGQSFDVDHRGQTVALWVQEDGIGKDPLADDDYIDAWFLRGRRHSTHSPMPMLVSSAGYALAVDTDARAVFALASEGADVARYEAQTDTLDVRVFAGDPAAPRVQLGAMIDWVGRAPAPPPVVFAPWLDAVFGSANVRAVAAHARAAGVASSVIWTEDWRGGSDTGTGYQLDENWRVDRSLYPDLEQVSADLHAEGYQLFTYFNSFLDQTGDVYAEATGSGFAIGSAAGGPYLFGSPKLGGSASLVDLTNPAAVAWTEEVLGEGRAVGGDGWMADFGEWEPTDAVLASGEDALAVHNRYPVDWTRANRAVLGDDHPFFVRAAWLHSQPLVSVLWPGDQQTDWSAGDGLPSVIPMGIGLGVTGFPLFGGDVGGYMSATTTTTTEELFYRWTTFGALQPVMRTHHGRSAREDFHWDHDDASIAHFSRWTRLHSQLAAYLQGTYGAYRVTGLPLMRLVALEDPGEAWAWSVTDEYLLGDRILVAPVQVEGATGRDVMLPAGSWYPLLGGGAAVASDGVSAIHADAAVTEIPAFVPAGAMLVLYPSALDTVNEAPGSPGVTTLRDIGADREVWLYPGTAARAAVGAWSDDAGPEGAAQWTWAGRAASAAAPGSATWNGAPIAVTATARGAELDVRGDGTLVLDTGGTLTIARGIPGARVHVLIQ